MSKLFSCTGNGCFETYLLKSVYHKKLQKILRNCFISMVSKYWYEYQRYKDFFYRNSVDIEYLSSNVFPRVV